MDLMQKVNERKAKIVIIGMGYVGFPLAVEFASAGFSVTGIDLIESKVKVINHGGSHIPDITSRLRERISQRIHDMTGIRVVEINGRIPGPTARQPNTNVQRHDYHKTQ